MPKWTIKREWRGEDVFIIGGGASLIGFNFNLLKDKKVIGVNDAFRLGSDIVDICIFGDPSWFHRRKWDLEKFEGRVVCVAAHLDHLDLPWMMTVPRVKSGLVANGEHVAWNYSTGATAIDVAIALGARRVFLLGFDLCAIDGKTHWHSHHAKMTTDSSFERFKKGFESIAASLKQKNLYDRVLNVTDGQSKLDCFKTIKFEDIDKPKIPAVSRIMEVT